MLQPLGVGVPEERFLLALSGFKKNGGLWRPPPRLIWVEGGYFFLVVFLASVLGAAFLVVVAVLLPHPHLPAIVILLMLSFLFGACTDFALVPL